MSDSRIEDLSPEEGIPVELIHRVGWIAVSWAMVEYGLDTSIRDIFRHHGGAGKPPASLNSKIAFLRKAFNQTTSLAAIAPYGHPLLDEVNALKHQRHDVLHGIVQGPRRGGYRLMRFRYDDAGHINERYEYTMQDLANLSRLASSLAERLSFLPDLITGKNVDEALRELAIGKPAVTVPRKKPVLDADD